jgi:hypothetical protein
MRGRVILLYTFGDGGMGKEAVIGGAVAGLGGWE